MLLGGTEGVLDVTKFEVIIFMWRDQMDQMDLNQCNAAFTHRKGICNEVLDRSQLVPFIALWEAIPLST